jgi:hypothetical protein
MCPLFSAGMGVMVYFHGGGWLDNKFTGKKINVASGSSCHPFYAYLMFFTNKKQTFIYLLLSDR